MCQRLVNQCVEFPIGQLGVFLSKLVLKGWARRCKIPFTRLSQSLLSLVIQGPALFAPGIPGLVGRGVGFQIVIHPVIQARFSTSSEEGEE